MGDRANVKMLMEEGGNSPIYLYTHWGGTELAETVRDALRRGESRWADGPYLARIIFSEMTKGRESSLTGFGIAPFICDNQHYIIEVSVVSKRVRFLATKWVPGVGHEPTGEVAEDWGFEEYVALSGSELRRAWIGSGD